MRRYLKAALVLFFVCLALLGAGLSFLHSPFFRYPTDGEYPPARIRELIWPSIGCPAMAAPGGEVVLELDLGDGEGAEATGWRARITPSREELRGLSFDLQPLGARRGASRRWPYREGEVWHASFRVPSQAPPELYDLSVEADSGGGRMSDAQPHALAVTGGAGGGLTFITLADVHVHERGNSSLFKRQTDKGISPQGEPLFFQEAIEQVNLLRPDFVLVLGDFVRGQRRPGELLSELERFYESLLRLQVPAFLLPGNHDGYVNDIDGKRWYEENIGPLYYSFDAGECHFACLDTYQWPHDDRVVMNKLIYREPRKWQGQVLGASDEADPATYEGELAWLEGDLAAHRGAPLKVLAMHHDPFSPGGRGYSYANVLGLFPSLGAGGGGGREALLSMASRHGVDAVFGGHLHRDHLGSLPWEEGGGETLYSCQSCVYFGAGGMSDSYPGYRLVRVEGGEIVSLAYLDGVSSYPLYDGSVPGGKTDLDALERPALRWEARESESAGGWGASVRVENCLGERMLLAGMTLEAPAPPPGGYELEGAELYRAVEVAEGSGRFLLYLRAEVGAGMPGEAGAPGTPAAHHIRIGEACISRRSAPRRGEYGAQPRARSSRRRTQGRRGERARESRKNANMTMTTVAPEGMSAR